MVSNERFNFSTLIKTIALDLTTIGGINFITGFKSSDQNASFRWDANGERTVFSNFNRISKYIFTFVFKSFESDAKQNDYEIFLSVRRSPDIALHSIRCQFRKNNFFLQIRHDENHIFNVITYFHVNTSDKNIRRELIFCVVFFTITNFKQIKTYLVTSSSSFCFNFEEKKSTDNQK